MTGVRSPAWPLRTSEFATPSLGSSSQGKKTQDLPSASWDGLGSFLAVIFIPSSLGHRDGEFVIIPNAAHLKRLCSWLSQLPSTSAARPSICPASCISDGIQRLAGASGSPWFPSLCPQTHRTLVLLAPTLPSTGWTLASLV